MFDVYLCNRSDSARYLLGKAGERMLLVVGLNPSTATRERSDVTASKVERVALGHGFDGFAMANLCPLRSTDPEALPAEISAYQLRQNQRAILELAARQVNLQVWAAWGSGITRRPYLLRSSRRLARAISGMGGRWLHFGPLSKGGHPRHPSRLNYAWRFNPFDSLAYTRKL
jgi:hypothetical protein